MQTLVLDFSQTLAGKALAAPDDNHPSAFDRISTILIDPDLR